MKHWLIVLALWLPLPSPAGEPVIRVGSKNFTEQIILGEIIAQLLEEGGGHRVERNFNLAGTQFTFEALLAGDIDIYPEYTGTGLVTILEQDVRPDPDEVFGIVLGEFEDRFHLRWLEPLGFNNTYTLAVRADDGRFTGIDRFSDLRPLAGDLTLGATHEFLERPDGYPRLAETYQLEFSRTSGLDPGLMYTAIDGGEVDVISAFSTDGRIDAFNLRVLDDDRGLFPPYFAAPLVRIETLEQHPEIAVVLNRLAGAISEGRMRQMNFLVDSEGRDPREVARNFLVDQGFLADAERIDLARARGNFFRYAWAQRGQLWTLTLEHLWLVGVSMGFAILFAIPLGIVLTRVRALRTPMFGVVNTLQTIPSLALLGFMIPLFGIGVLPAVVALFLYALLPLVRNTYAGILDVDPDVREAAKGIGLTDFQILRKVEFPIALPVIMAGIRTSTVIVIGTATLAALIGAGGYGDPIFRGIAAVNSNLILLGAVPAAVLAIVLDRLLQLAENRLVSPGLQSRRR